MKFQPISTPKTRSKTTYRTIYRTQMGPFPGLTMASNGNQPNFKSPTSLQTDTWKKGLEALLLLWWCLNQTSTGSEKTRQNLEMRKHPMLKPLGHYISIGQTCDQRQLHKTKVHSGTSGNVSMLTMTSRMKVPDLWPVLQLQFQEAVHGILLNPPFQLWCTLSGERISSREDIVQSTQHAQCAQCAQMSSNVCTFQM